MKQEGKGRCTPVFATVSLKQELLATFQIGMPQFKI
jgi:hypothetical protein